MHWNHERNEDGLAGAKTLIVGAVGLAAIASAVAVPLAAGASGATPRSTPHKTVPTLQSHSIHKYGSILVDGKGWSLYLLSAEENGKIHCKGSCVSFWPPLMVARNAKLTKGPGVKGKIGHVTRGTKWQVTYNGWPVYTYAGDTGAHQSNGEKIKAFGGTWYLIKAGATTRSSSPDKGSSSGSTTTTTTTSAGGGGTTTTTSPGW